MTEPEPKPRTIVETIEVAGADLLQKVRDLITEGNVRRLRIRAGEDLAIEMPLTVGAVVGGVVVLAAPWLAVLGVVAALVAKVQIEVERDADGDGKPGGDGKPPTEP